MSHCCRAVTLFMCVMEHLSITLQSSSNMIKLFLQRYRSISCRYSTVAPDVHQSRISPLPSSHLPCIRYVTQKIGTLYSLSCQSCRSEVDAGRKATETFATIEMFPHVRLNRAAGESTRTFVDFSSYILWSLVVSVSTFLA